MNDEPDNKRPKSTIGTHDGTFHCDEALACFMLKQLPEYKEAEIIRSRNPKILDTCDVVVDVGGVYHPAKHRYDHHQKSFNISMNSISSTYPWITKLSSAGLIYAHFGRRILSEVLHVKIDDVIIEKVYPMIYEHFVEEIDAIDNGISVCPDKPKYLITTNLSARVGHLNPWWNDKNPDVEGGFLKAMTLVGEELLDRIKYYAYSWWPARELVLKSVEERFQVDASGEIIILNGGGYPWKDHLFTIEDEMKLSVAIKFAIFQDTNGSWRVQAVPVRSNSFELRIPLLQEWQGLRDKELDSVSQISDCVFVHSTGFIGGNKTKDGALQMARVTLSKHVQASTSE